MALPEHFLRGAEHPQFPLTITRVDSAQHHTALQDQALCICLLVLEFSIFQFAMIILGLLYFISSDSCYSYTVADYSVPKPEMAKDSILNIICNKG